MCFPGGTQIFDWKYDSEASRVETIWYWNSLTLMRKIGDTIFLNSNSQFYNRIWEYNETNCGLIVFDVKSNDTGTFEVSVELTGGTYYSATQNMTVTEDAGMFCE